MEYATLGQTAIKISRIAFGCEALGGYDWGKVEEREAIEAVRRALDMGVNFFDTADVYGLGRSEELLSEALGSQRQEMVVATKFGVSWEPTLGGGRARTFRDTSPKRVVEALEGSLRRLRLDSIPLYQVHWPNTETPVEDTMEALARCREQGKIRHLGYANAGPAVIRSAFQVCRLESLQAPYNLLYRSIEGETIQCCAALGMSILAYGPLAQGLLTGKYGKGSVFDEDDRRHRLGHFRGKEMERGLIFVSRLEEIAGGYGKTIAQVALRWVLDKPFIGSAIVGIKTPAQIEANAGAAGWRLSPSDLAYLEGETIEGETPDNGAL